MKEYKGLTEEEMMAAMIEVATVNAYVPDEDDEDGKPYTICDKNDTLYDKIEKVKVPKSN